MKKGEGEYPLWGWGQRGANSKRTRQRCGDGVQRRVTKMATVSKGKDMMTDEGWPRQRRRPKAKA